MYDVKSQKVLGSFEPKDGLWSIPFEYDPDDADLISTRGRLYIVVDFEASPNIDLHLASKIIIDEIKEKYYGDLDGTPLQALENALIAGKNKLHEISESNKNAISSLSFNIVSAVVWGRVIYVAQVGDTSCLIIRNGEAVDISNKTSGEVMTSSGLLESDDVAIIGTKNFQSNFNNKDLLANLGSLDKLFQNSSQSVSLSVVVIRFKKSVVPSKRDISNFISSLNIKNKDSKVESKEEDLSKSTISSITAIDSAPVKEKNNRGRKQKKLILSLLFTFIFGGVAGSGYYLYSKGIIKMPYFDKPTIAVVDTKSYEDRFNSLVSSQASIDEYAELVADLQKELASDVSNENIISLLDKSEQKIIELSNTNISSSSNLLIDLSSKSRESKINKISKVGEDILISDVGAKKVFFADLSDNNNLQEIAVSGSFLIATYSGNKYYIVNSESIYVGDAIDSLSEYKLDVPISNASDIAVYFDNIYIVSENLIYKYTLDSNNYIQSIWTTIEGGNLNSIAIDGSVYITNGDTVEKFYTGKKEVFNISKMPSSLVAPLFIYTERDSDIIYLSDKNAVYTLDKDSGEYSSQLSLQDVKVVPSGIAFDTNAVYISSGSRVFKIDR